MNFGRYSDKYSGRRREVADRPNMSVVEHHRRQLQREADLAAAKSSPAAFNPLMPAPRTDFLFARIAGFFGFKGAR